jgi:hypothetical protein
MLRHFQFLVRRKAVPSGLAALLFTFFAARPALAEFELIETLDTPPFNTLARGDGEWHAAGISGWWTFDDEYSVPWVLTEAAGVSNILEVAYDQDTDRMVLLEWNTGEVRYHSMDGTFQSSFSTGLVSANGMAWDPRDGSIWVGNFSGFVRHYGADGTFLDGFNSGLLLSGLTLDPVNDSLLLLRADGSGGIGGPLDDELWEFSSSGDNLGRLWSVSEIPGNGSGLEYLPHEGKLYIKSGINPHQPSQPFNATRIYQDLGRIPEPSTGCIALLAVVLCSGRRSLCRVTGMTANSPGLSR